MPRKVSGTQGSKAASAREQRAIARTVRRRAPARARSAATKPAAPDPIESRQQEIAQAACFIAESQGFPSDCAIDHWLIAEIQIDGRAMGVAGAGTDRPDD